MKILGFHRIVASLALALALVFGAQPGLAQEAAEATAAQVESAAPAAGEAAPAEVNAETADAAADADAATENAGYYTPMKPVEGIGMPTDRAINVQQQFSPNGEFANSLHTGLIWVMVIISVFVALLLIVTMVRFRKGANPVPSKTSHNTLIEVVWTVVPALILLVIAIPSITLIARQYEPIPKDAITIKAIGVQWNWEYEYPDYEVSLISKMLNIPGQPITNNGVRELGSEPWDGPSHLEVDNRLVVPVGVPIRLQVTANDVIHSFAVPALWFKLDAVPGRLNEKMLTIDKPGVYYGQCSELCGVKHGYMPIAVEAVPMDKFEAFILAKGGKLGGDEAVEEEAAAEGAEALEADVEADAPAAEPAV